jgi:hypothetical protein
LKIIFKRQPGRNPASAGGKLCILKREAEAS